MPDVALIGPDGKRYLVPPQDVQASLAEDGFRYPNEKEAAKQEEKKEYTKPKTYEKPKVESKAEITYASHSVNGDGLVLNFNVSEPFTGKCKGWITKDGKNVYEFVAINNGTSCSVTLNVAGLSGSGTWKAVGKLKNTSGVYVCETAPFEVNL